MSGEVLQATVDGKLEYRDVADALRELDLDADVDDDLLAGLVEIQSKRDVIDAAPIDVFAASNIRTYWYPYRLQHIGYANDRIRRLSRRYILDSDIKDPSVTNQAVLDRALELDADVVVPKDYLPFRVYDDLSKKDGWTDEQDQALRDLRSDFDDNVSATTASIQDFQDAYADHAFDGEYLVPLQPPHTEHYQEFPDADGYLLGGIKDWDADAQVQAMKDFRDVAGPEPYVHALGLGFSWTLVEAFRENPGMVDSIDLSTPEQMGKNAKVPGPRWEQNDCYVAPGDKSSAVRGDLASFALLRFNYDIGPDVNTEKDDRFDDLFSQSGLGDW